MNAFVKNTIFKIANIKKKKNRNEAKYNISMNHIKTFGANLRTTTLTQPIRKTYYIQTLLKCIYILFFYG